MPVSPSFPSSGSPAMDCLLLALFFLAAGAGSSLILARRPADAHVAGLTGAVSGCLLGLASAVMILVHGQVVVCSFPWATAGILLSFRLDGLAAFFLLPVFAVGLAAAIYGFGYLRHDCQKGAAIGLHWLFLNLLLAAMAAVVTAANALQFLLAWELMSLSSFSLVVYRHEDEAVRRAGWLYLIATHLGVCFLFALFLFAAFYSGSLDFSGFAALGALSPLASVGIFFLALVGFGSKAGLFPLHVWLAEAHPAAPSHVSALMSGVMIKTAIYGLLRIIAFLPPLPAWCGIVLLVLGLAGVLFGVGLAIAEDDIKRSLAYSTVENIGLIFVGLGLWLLGRANGWPAAAGIALAAALLHVWNHAFFKGLLFLAAGSVVHSTGSRRFSHYGGLLKRMPVTGLMLIAGSAAVAGLPPLNGFVSEFCLYLGVIRMGQQAGGLTMLLLLLVLALLALAGALVLLAVCRLAGLTLLGGPRRPEAAAAAEASPLMLAGMAFLLTLCLVSGLAPGLPFAAVAAPLAVLGVSLAPGREAASFLLDPRWTFAAATILAVAGWLLLSRYRRAAEVCRQPTWGCGFNCPTSRMAYTAGGFSQLAQDAVFRASLAPENAVSVRQGFFAAPGTFRQKIIDPVLVRLCEPMFAGFAALATSFRLLQAGRVNIYLLYMGGTTLILLGWAMLHRA